MSQEEGQSGYNPIVHGPDWALYEEKTALRAAQRAKLAALDPMERAERSRQFCARLREFPVLRQARRALLFAPLPTEPDLNRLWSLGSFSDKQCAFPRVEDTSIRLYYVRALDELEATRWGLREPLASAEHEANLQDFDVVLVPGLAFDARGGRLGRGGGFYDRLLAGRGKRTTLIGCCFALQRVDIVPSAPHDVSMDYVFTDAGLLL